MAFDAIPKNIYPVVPNLPGVPAVLRSGAAIIDTATFGKLGAGTVVDNLLGTSATRWGVFDTDGKPIADFESVIAVEYQSGWQLPTHPMEKGAFATYNKVAQPYSIKVRLSRGGSEADRTAFITAIESACKSLSLLTVVTDVATYQRANIRDSSYKREQRNGATIIIYELTLAEIRETATSEFSKPKEPASQDIQSGGQVQPTAPRKPVPFVTEFA